MKFAKGRKARTTSVAHASEVSSDETWVLSLRVGELDGYDTNARGSSKIQYDDGDQSDRRRRTDTSSWGQVALLVTCAVASAAREMRVDAAKRS